MNNLSKLQAPLTTILSAPSPDAIWNLQSRLLEAGYAAEAGGWKILNQFHLFLTEITAHISSYEFSRLATMLDIGAVGSVALQNLIESDITPSEMWKRLLAGGIGEGLMVMASHQYVKSAKAELLSIYQHAAWYLYQAHWHLSEKMQPQLPADQRRQLLENLFAPMRNKEADDVIKIVLATRLFQVLLLVELRMEIGD